MTSEYTEAEAFMIMCITRSMECSPSKCKRCGWLRSDVRESIGGLSDEQLLAKGKDQTQSKVDPDRGENV